ncbi:MAG: DinB family protein [Bacteroidota bacterium]
MTAFARPVPGTYPTYFDTYISLVKGESIYEELYQSYMDTMELVTSLDLETLHFRYAEGKWTILDILQHVMDAERIFCFRALSFARSEKASLPGFEEDEYVAAGFATKRNINDMVREFSILRASTIELFKSFSAEMLDQKGNANGKDVTPRALLFIILGHEIHHRNIIQQRYMST